MSPIAEAAPPKPVPLVVDYAYDSNLGIGQSIGAGTNGLTGVWGKVIVNLPFSAAIWSSGACNDFMFFRSQLTAAGALQVGIRSQQRFGCLIPWSAKVSARPFSNSQSRIELVSMTRDGKAQKGVITGTEIGMMPTQDGSGAIFAMQSGTMNVTASNGQEVKIVAGQMATASDQGVKVTRIPRPWFQITWLSNEDAVISAAEGIRLEVDGVQVAPGQRVTVKRVVKAINVIGIEYTRVYPHPRYRNRAQQ